jgi:hypothetical protein
MQFTADEKLLLKFLYTSDIRGKADLVNSLTPPPGSVARIE